MEKEKTIGTKKKGRVVRWEGNEKTAKNGFKFVLTKKA